MWARERNTSKFFFGISECSNIVFFFLLEMCVRLFFSVSALICVVAVVVATVFCFHMSKNSNTVLFDTLYNCLMCCVYAALLYCPSAFFVCSLYFVLSAKEKEKTYAKRLCVVLYERHNRR